MRALFDFALKTLFRSTQPRVVMAFYWGLGLAFVVAFVKSPSGQQLASAGDAGTWYESSVPSLVASILMMGAAVVAARSAFAMPRDLNANWIFRMVPVRDGRAYGVARRRAFLAVSVIPVWTISAIAFLSMWPWTAAAGHLIVLALLGLMLVDTAELGTGRIPFACSYLPGRSRVHITAVIVVLLIIPIVVGVATFEKEALQDGMRYALMLAALGVTWSAARLRTMWLVPSADGSPVFDAEPEDRVVTLELWDTRLPNADLMVRTTDGL